MTDETDEPTEGQPTPDNDPPIISSGPPKLPPPPPPDGQRAAGGPLPPGRFYLVGARGPECFLF